MNESLRRTGLVLAGMSMLAMAGWGVPALYYFDHEPQGLRAGLAASFALFSLAAFAAFALSRWRWHVAAGYLLLFALLLGRWQAIAPSNDRDWRPEAARIPHASVAGDLVTVHDVRNFDYRTETDFTAAYDDRTFDLRQLEAVDLVAVYWMGPAIAHVFMSFGFADGRHLAVSIEARKERNEAYSTLKGFFRQYELQYVAADERDVIRLRTNYRRDPPEEVHVYRLQGEMEDARKLFLEYAAAMNRLKAQPEFYNALTTNCTSVIWLNARVNPGHVPYSWKILASGYVPQYLYEQGRLDFRRPFAELQRRSIVNERAQAADGAPDFSRRIRAL